jgi:hypothetical protein
MKKNYNGVRWRHLLLMFIIFVMVGSIVSDSFGEEEKKVRWGFSVFGGTGDATYRKADMEVYGFIPRMTLPLYKKWKLDFEIEGNFFYYNIHKMPDVYFLGLSHNFVFKPIQERWGSLFLLAGAGIGYDSAGKRLKRAAVLDDPLLGDQHFAGFFHGGLGVLFNIGRGKALRVEYRFCHISEPFDTGDRGMNTHNFLLGISF